MAETWEGDWEAEARESVDDDRGLTPAILSAIYNYMEAVRCDYNPSQQSNLAVLQASQASKARAETLSLSNSIINICDQTNKLQHIDLLTLTISEVEMDMEHVFPVKSSWVLLPSQGLVIVCGGVRAELASSEVLGVQLQASLVMSLGEMTEGRWEAGIIETADRIFVFGGLSPELKATCESFDLATNTWLSIGNMHSARAGFTPALWKQSIILVGGLGTGNIEAYDLSQGQFHQIPLQLPYADQYTTALVTGEEMVIVQRDKLVGMSLRGGNRRVYDIAQLEKPGWWFSPTCPVSIAADVFLLDWACDAKVWKYSSHTLVAVLSLTT